MDSSFSFVDVREEGEKSLSPAQKTANKAVDQPQLEEEPEDWVEVEKEEEKEFKERSASDEIIVVVSDCDSSVETMAPRVELPPVISESQNVQENGQDDVPILADTLVSPHPLPTNNPPNSSFNSQLTQSQPYQDNQLLVDDSSHMTSPRSDSLSSPPVHITLSDVVPEPSSSSTLSSPTLALNSELGCEVQQETQDQNVAHPPSISTPNTPQETPLVETPLGKPLSTESTTQVASLPLPASSSAPPQDPAIPAEKSKPYRVRSVLFNQQPRTIVHQDVNGPCPLVALCNVLSLQGKIHLSVSSGFLTYDQLVGELSNYLFTFIDRVPESRYAEVEHKIQSFIEMVGRIQNGVDVNIKFHSGREFEFTAELDMFDLFGIELVHAWVVDPQEEVAALFGKQTYNQIVDAVVHALSHTPNPPISEHAAHVINAWLDDSARQVTFAGIAELFSFLKEGEPCVLFRNNHFCTLIKLRDRLYTLVSDEGYVHTNIVWETLSSPDGDESLLDAAFRIPAPSLPSDSTPFVDPGDEDLARLLQREEEEMQRTRQQEVDRDAEFARQLDARERHPQPPYSQHWA